MVERCKTLVLLFATLVALATAYPSMQTQVPNGDNVYYNGKHWPAIGHALSKGERIGAGKTGDNSISLNSFGMMMKVEGMHWTQITCNGDADGDGYTNGEELGDPDCTWTKGKVPSRTTDISHPGYADSVPLGFKSKAQLAAEALYEETELRVVDKDAVDDVSVTQPKSSLEALLDSERIEAALRAAERQEDRRNGKSVEAEDVVLAKEATELNMKIHRLQLDEQRALLEKIALEKPLEQGEEGLGSQPSEYEYNQKNLPDEEDIANLLLKKDEVKQADNLSKEDL